ncbi:hypothetical protein [Mycobacteroides franklinii]|uniref:Uncharacterized protein n=1 Tax=Mycobacteroides franklinii TaxID=948102 RepID=A0A4R5PFA9_9MYCO|nr:hypothetical protein [Mycobacteroides franklinii]ORA59308.1 hypothetical protein BST24_18350 [Mycobacteroides franklinii]TDH24416.1 hypothetical protein EJ571_04645 [Mycobacteroides franklinii]
MATVESPERQLETCRELCTQRGYEVAGEDTRVKGYNGQSVPMQEVDDLRKSQSLLLSMIKSLRMPEECNGDGKLTRSQVGRIAADARWHG